MKHSRRFLAVLSVLAFVASSAVAQMGYVGRGAPNDSMRSVFNRNFQRIASGQFNPTPSALAESLKQVSPTFDLGWRFENTLEMRSGTGSVAGKKLLFYNPTTGDTAWMYQGVNGHLYLKDVSGEHDLAALLAGSGGVNDTTPMTGAQVIDSLNNAVRTFLKTMRFTQRLEMRSGGDEASGEKVFFYNPSTQDSAWIRLKADGRIYIGDKTGEHSLDSLVGGGGTTVSLPPTRQSIIDSLMRDNLQLTKRTTFEREIVLQSGGDATPTYRLLFVNPTTHDSSWLYMKPDGRLYLRDPLAGEHSLTAIYNTGIGGMRDSIARLLQIALPQLLTPGTMVYLASDDTLRSATIAAPLLFNSGTLSLLRQMSITADALGLKLVNDQENPGSNAFYGTNVSGYKTWKFLFSVENTWSATQYYTAPNYFGAIQHFEDTVYVGQREGGIPGVIGFRVGGPGNYHTIYITAQPTEDGTIGDFGAFRYPAMPVGTYTITTHEELEDSTIALRAALERKDKTRDSINAVINHGRYVLVYEAKISQSGTSAPTAVAVYNATGTTATWSYEEGDDFSARLTFGAAISGSADSISVFTTSSSAMIVVPIVATGEILSTTAMKFTTYGPGADPVGGNFNKTPIQVWVLKP